MSKNYIVKEHEANMSVGRLEPEDLLRFLNQSIAITKGLQNLDEELKEWIDNISEECGITSCTMESVLTDDETDDLLEILEDAEIQDYDCINLFYSHCYSTWDSLNAYLRTTVFTIIEFNKLINKLTSSWTCPTMEELKKIHNYARSILTNLLFIVYFEFDMDSVNNLVDGRYYIDEIYNKYCMQYGLDPEEHTKVISELKYVYRIKLDIFDEYPELEESFEAIMGPNYANIDEEKLTIQIVKGVLSGEMSELEAYDLIKREDVELDPTIDVSSTGRVANLENMNMF